MVEPERNVVNDQIFVDNDCPCGNECAGAVIPSVPLDYPRHAHEPWEHLCVLCHVFSLWFVTRLGQAHFGANRLMALISNRKSGRRWQGKVWGKKIRPQQRSQSKMYECGDYFASTSGKRNENIAQTLPTPTGRAYLCCGKAIRIIHINHLLKIYRFFPVHFGNKNNYISWKYLLYV